MVVAVAVDRLICDNIRVSVDIIGDDSRRRNGDVPIFKGNLDDAAMVMIAILTIAVIVIAEIVLMV